MKKITPLFFYLGLAFCFHNAWAQKIISKADYYLTDESGKKISAVFSSLDDFNDSGIAIFSLGGVKNESRDDYYGTSTLKGAKYGLINNKGKIVVEANYDYISRYNYSNDTLFTVTTGEKKGLLNHKGRWILPVEYKEITYNYYDYAVIRITTNDNKQQLLSMDGKAITGLYDYIDMKKNGASIREKSNYGWLDATYKISIPTEYKKLEYLKSCDKFIAKDKFSKYYIINAKNEKIPGVKYDEISPIYSRENYEDILGYKIKYKGKYGFMNTDFKVVIKPSLNDISDIQFNCNSFVLSCEKKSREVYLHDANGVKIGKNKFHYISSSTAFDKYMIATPYKKSGVNDYYGPTEYVIIDTKGVQVLPGTYSQYKNSYSSTVVDLLMLESKGSWTAYNQYLEPVISSKQVAPEKISRIDDLGENYFSVQIGGDASRYGSSKAGIYAVYDGYGKQILPFEYEEISYSSSAEMFQFKKAGKYGFMKTDGSIMFQPEYSYIGCSGEYCVVKKYFEKDNSEKYGIINTKLQKEIISPKFDYLKSVYYGTDNTYIFKENNKFGLLSAKNDKYLLEPKYNYLESAQIYNQDYYLVNNFGSIENSGGGWDWGGGSSEELTAKGGVWGAINLKGDTIIPIKFKKINFLRDTLFIGSDEEDKTHLYKIPGAKKITPDGANFLERLGYGDEPTYLMGKNVVMDEYGSRTSGIYGVAGGQGKIIIDFKYAEIENSGEDFLCTMEELKGFDLINKDGKTLISGANSIDRLNDSFYLVKKDENVFLFKSKSNTTSILENIVSCNVPEYLYSNGIIGVKTKDNKWGAINSQAEWIIQPTYCDLSGVNNESIIAAVCEGAVLKYGVIDAEKNILIPFEYESIESSYGGEFRCLKNNLIYRVNLSNEILNTEKASDSKLRGFE